MRKFIAILTLVATLVVAARLDAFHPLHVYFAFVIQRLTAVPFTLPYPAPPSPDQWRAMTASQRLADTRRRLLPKLHDELAQKQLQLGQHAFIRIFKESRELELWLRQASGVWKRFRTYPVATFSGFLGPKQREGDMQAPEGFYAVTTQLLNPASSYHLAFNIGYPNAYDRHHQRTGSLIMVHGNEVSVGCFAMTDPLIEEIYLVVAAALENGQPHVPVHAFPFRMTEERMTRARAENSEWLPFWENLREGHDLFEKRQKPPQTRLAADRYHFD
ncbi:MAG: murein L,D-transpeptidase [Verrucomicrobiaceae bacterium]|nr:murein L,D-transpeptidase [Verrucomicrobiaceae bacterium]